MMRAVWVMAGLFLACASGPALAQDADAEDSSSGRIVKSFADCRAITAPDARLACFDKAAATLETAIATKEVRIVDRADIRKARRSLFGFTLPRIRLFGGSDNSEEADQGGEEEFTEINTKVASARPVGNGHVEIRLADDTGAVWHTKDTMKFPPKPGADIRIRKGAMGNYFLAVDGRSYRGMRVR